MERLREQYREPLVLLHGGLGSGATGEMGLGSLEKQRCTCKRNITTDTGYLMFE